MASASSDSPSLPVAELELDAAGHGEAGEHPQRALGEAQKLEPLEPARDLGGQLPDLRAPEVEVTEVLERLELEEPLVGEAAAGEVERGEILE